jgi:hypothetical protein
MLNYENRDLNCNIGKFGKGVKGQGKNDYSLPMTI